MFLASLFEKKLRVSNGFCLKQTKFKYTSFDSTFHMWVGIQWAIYCSHYRSKFNLKFSEFLLQELFSAVGVVFSGTKQQIHQIIGKSSRVGFDILFNQRKPDNVLWKCDFDLEIFFGNMWIMMRISFSTVKCLKKSRSKNNGFVRKIWDKAFRVRCSFR